MEDIVFLNGDLIPLREAKIAVTDYGFLYGYGLFETMRAYNGKVFRLEAHLSRLEESAERLGIKVDNLSLKSAVIKTIQKNELSDARVRLTVSIGEGNLSPDLRSGTKSTVLVVTTKYVPFAQDTYKKGFRAIFSTICRNSQSPLSSMKTSNYLECMLARQEAKAAGVDESLLLNEAGLLAEGSMSNIFLVDHETLKTPRIRSGILPGITRAVVLELASEMGIKVLEADILPEELVTTDQAFLTNSLMEVMPLTEVKGKPVRTGRPGDITQGLMKAYKDLVARES